MRTTALNKFIRDLSSPDVSKRRAAAKALGDADERGIYPLIDALRDPNPGVQDAARSSLTEIGGEVVAYMVLPLLREDSYLRNTARLILKGLGSISVPLLYPLLADKDEDVRKFCLDLMAEIRDGVLPEMLIPLIDDPNPNVRAAALQAVGALGYRAGVEHVVRALSDEEWVCFSALETLGALSDERAVEAITGLLSNASDTLKVAALETLGKIGSPRARDAIVRLISGAAGDVKAAAVKSLVQIGIPSGMQELGGYLMDMLSESEWDEKLIALKGLLDLKEERAIRLIIDTAGSLDPSVPVDDERLRIIMEALEGFGCTEEFVKILADPGIRYKGKGIAADMVANLGCEDAVPVLIELFDSRERGVKRACIRALGRMENPEAKNAVMQALSDPDGHIRKEAAASLGRTGGEEAFSLLLEGLEEEEYDDVMEESVKSLLRINPEGMISRLAEFSDRVREAVARFSEDIDVLFRLSGDGDLDVRVSALSSLGNLGEQKAVQKVIVATRDREPRVRRAAVMSLLGAEFSPEELKPLLSDTDMMVRLHAVRALGQSRKKGVVEMLKPASADSETAVALAAVEAFAVIGGDEAREMLNSMADHPSEEVRGAVRQVREKV